MSWSAIHSDGAAWISGASVETLGVTVEKGRAAEIVAAALPVFVTRSATMAGPAVEMGGRREWMAAAFKENAAPRVKSLDRVIENSGASVAISDAAVENSDARVAISSRAAKSLAAFEFSTRAAHLFFSRAPFHAAASEKKGRATSRISRGADFGAASPKKTAVGANPKKLRNRKYVFRVARCE